MGFPEDAHATDAVTSPFLGAGVRHLPETEQVNGFDQQNAAVASPPSAPGFDAYAADAGVGTYGGIDWQSAASDGWSISFSPYDTGRPAKNASSIAPFDVSLLAKKAPDKQVAEFDSMGRALLGERGGAGKS